MNPNYLRANKLHEQLAARLAGGIVSGRLVADAPLPSEPKLVAEYGVSKTVVRETVQALVAVGMVRVQHGKRTLVLPESEWDILSPLVQEAYRAEGLTGSLVGELYELRLLLEPQAARWTAERAKPREREELKRIIDDMNAAMRRAAVTGGDDEFLLYDREFHLAIAAAASNRVLRAIIRDVHERLTMSWSWSVLSEEEVQTAFDQHLEIAEAIVAGDGDAAEAAMRVHLEWAARTDRNANWPRTPKPGRRAVESRRR